MSFLEQMTPDHRQTIVRLPYRVGLLVSRSDVSGGADADEREKQALSNILHAFTEELFGSETIQHIMSATIREKASWGEWGANLDSVLDECRVAIDILREYDRKDAKAFKTHLIEIAEAVAQAFREDENVSVFSAFGMYVKYVLSGSKRGRRVKTFNEFLNISAGEMKALEKISDALEAA